MKTNSSRSEKQLFNAFCQRSKSGKWQRIGSGLETSEGKRSLWTFLAREGHVVKMPGGGGLGHPFSFNLTDKGRDLLETLCSAENQADLDDATESERNDFSK